MAKNYEPARIAKTAAKYKMRLPERNPFEKPIQYLKRIEKAANERMRQLEKLSESKEYKGVKEFAYRSAAYDIAHLFQKEGGLPRFGLKGIRKTKEGGYNEQDVEARIRSVERFMAAPSSTKGGINKVYKEKANTLNKRYDTDYSWQDWARIFKSKQWDKLKEKYGSDVVIEALVATEDMDKDEIQKMLDKDMKISDSEVRDEQIKKFLEENDVTELF